MTQSCLFLEWHYPSSGLILEIGRSEGSDFYFLQDDSVHGPFDSFCDNGDIIEFHYRGIFYQFLITSKQWYAVAPWKSKIVEYEKIVEINNFIYLSQEMFASVPALC